MVDEKGAEPAAHLDIRGVPCPINFVKTKLALEKLQSGQVLEVMVSGDAAKSLPESVEDDGHSIVQNLSEADAHRLWILKA